MTTKKSTKPIHKPIHKPRVITKSKEVESNEIENKEAKRREKKKIDVFFGVARVARMWHPYQKIYIDTVTPVALKMDSWLECQIEAKLIYQT